MHVATLFWLLTKVSCGLITGGLNATMKEDFVTSTRKERKDNNAAHCACFKWDISYKGVCGGKDEKNRQWDMHQN